jgi:hypothetical protein
MQSSTATGLAQNKVIGFAAGIGGLIVGRYTGMALLLPLAFAWGAYAVGRKRLSGHHLMVLPAAAVVIGHLGWMILAAILLRQGAAVWLDVLLFGAALTWLLQRPAELPLWILSAMQLLGVAINLSMIGRVEFGSSMHKGMVVHIVFRVTSIILNIVAIRAIGRGEDLTPVPASR